MNDFCKPALSVIEIEAQAISALSGRINNDFAQACQYLFDCQGRIIVLGMGKSGHIGRKIAATFASTGTPAFFVHPAEASHGDMGMITKNDAVLAISNSGETSELITLLPYIKRLNIPLISMTGAPTSTLAKAATINIDISVEIEACPLGLAPTSSTTASLVLGDAIAVALLEARGFTKEDFAMSHPGGKLGKRLLLRSGDLMHQGDDIPTVTTDTLLTDALMVITEKKLGMTAVINGDGKIEGVFTDGDLRRTLDAKQDLHQTNISEVMTSGGRSISPDMLAAEALSIMEQHKITTLMVVDQTEKLIGVLHLHKLLAAGIA